jgi:acyl-CoA thioesterase I
MTYIKSIGLCIVCMLLPQIASCYTILTIGDSITVGYPYTYPIEAGNGGRFGIYQNILSGYLSKVEQPSAIYNWGMGGESSYGGAIRINHVLSSRRADYILILYGTNDLYAGISPSTTRRNITIMIDRAVSKNVTPIVGTITPNTMTSGYDALLKNHYNPGIIAAAQSRNAALADHYASLRPKWSTTPLHSGDRLHPNSTGYSIIAKTWYYVIVELNKKTNISPILNLLLLD